MPANHQQLGEEAGAGSPSGHRRYQPCSLTAFRTGESTFQLLKPHSLWLFVTAAQENDYSQDTMNYSNPGLGNSFLKKHRLKIPLLSWAVCPSCAHLSYKSGHAPTLWDCGQMKRVPIMRTFSECLTSTAGDTHWA